MQPIYLKSKLKQFTFQDFYSLLKTPFILKDGLPHNHHFCCQTKLKERILSTSNPKLKIFWLENVKKAVYYTRFYVISYKHWWFNFFAYICVKKHTAAVARNFIFTSIFWKLYHFLQKKEISKICTPACVQSKGGQKMFNKFLKLLFFNYIKFPRMSTTLI